MADEDKSLRIAIVTEAEGAGAEETKRKLEEVKGEAKALKDVQSAQESATRSQKEAVEATQAQSERVKELRHGLKGAAFEIPSLRYALHALLSPMALVGMAAGSVAAKLIELWRELDRPIKVSQLTSGLGQIKDAVDQLPDAGQEARRGLEDVGRGADDLTKRFNATAAAIRELASLEAERLSGELALELAKVDEAEQAGREGRPGGIGRAAAIRRRQALRTEYVQRKAQVEIGAIEEEIRNKSEELALAEQESRSAQERLRLAKEARARLPGRKEFEARKGDVKSRAEQLQGLQDEYLKAESEFREWEERKGRRPVDLDKAFSVWRADETKVWAEFPGAEGRLGSYLLARRAWERESKIFGLDKKSLERQERELAAAEAELEAAERAAAESSGRLGGLVAGDPRARLEQRKQYLIRQAELEQQRLQVEGQTELSREEQQRRLEAEEARLRQMEAEYRATQAKEDAGRATVLAKQIRDLQMRINRSRYGGADQREKLGAADAQAEAEYRQRLRDAEEAERRRQERQQRESEREIFERGGGRGRASGPGVSAVTPEIPVDQLRAAFVGSSEEQGRQMAALVGVLSDVIAEQDRLRRQAAANASAIEELRQKV